MKIAKRLKEHNTVDYNLLKAAEEFQELALVLTQRLTKPTRITDSAIIEEIGDCKIRLKVLEELFDKDKIKTRVQFKATRFGNYIKKYKNV